MSRETPAGRWPRSVYGVGVDPDPRFSLANERTFLAWIRTALALLAGAAAAHVFELDVPSAVSRAISASLALSGLLCAANAWWGWSRTERALRLGLPLPANVGGAVLTVAIGAVAVLVVVVAAVS